MIIIKTTEEIEKLRNSNQLVSKTLAEIAKYIEPGVTTEKLDKIAEEFIRDNNAIPGFLNYNGYPKTLCTSVNSQVVHGIPSSYVLKDGDVVSVDCGVILDGFYGDTAYSFEIGEVAEPVRKLLRITKEALYLGVEKAIEGNRIGDIGFAIQQHSENAGYSVVREMVGHGLGRNLHEEPEVPNYGSKGTGVKVKKGMVICIEPMINMGKKQIVQEADGWTIRTSDNMPSAHFELAVAVDNGKPDILSTFSYIEQVLKSK
ncbi:MAG: type I methionyl aminopeptidase [Bacteroidales bacterium]|nr:type I methionyl aminopeptidase [Bacteroidales bacterium]MCB8999242.1 type I methionyl aminopeptidase [Bacteroidales bacterium]MCB9013090.1 type I methionyl aminopeptidase [Bacteroidales bacterium]